MKQKIKQAILTILEQKRRNGDVLPFATSIEVAHLLHMNAVEVEMLSEDIEGIVKGKTINHGYYYEEGEKLRFKGETEKLPRSNRAKNT